MGRVARALACCCLLWGIGCEGEAPPADARAVTDGVADATMDAAADAGRVTAEELFDPTRVRRFELTVDPADLRRIEADPRAEEYVPAELRYGEVTVRRVGLRFKGSVGSLSRCFDASGRRTCSKLSMKVDVDQYVDGQRFAGLEHLNFHAMMRDPSQMKDRLGYGLFRRAGVHAPRSAHARLVINGVDQGLFALVEEIDGEFVEDHFRPVDGGEGNLYKEVWPVSSGPERYRAALETHRGATTDVGRMMRFAEALRGATPETFRAVISSWTDLPALVSYLAVDRLIDHWDGIVGWYCPSGRPEACVNHNYFWYEETARDRVWLLPWDLDLAMQVPNPIRTTFGMPDWNAPPTDCSLRPVILNIEGRPPACDRFVALMAQVLWPDYQARTAEILAGPASPEALEAEIAAMEVLLAPEVATDRFGPGEQAWRRAVADLRADLPRLRARVAP